MCRYRAVKPRVKLCRIRWWTMACAGTFVVLTASIVNFVTLS
ncbi:Uncharacterised protein [Vibrio cholerae]|nr:Uncharacterised protein [Vibrio cholerae]CSI52348.1 Uncharacterised protein [Vibrio cholerae]